MLLQRATQHARRVISLALLALLVSQLGALVHAVVHAPLLAGGLAQGRQVGHPHAHEQAAAAGATAETGVAAADHHSAGSPVCQVIDHLLFGQAPGSPDAQFLAQFWPDPEPPHRPALFTPARPAQAYEARGPPRA